MHRHSHIHRSRRRPSTGILRSPAASAHPILINTRDMAHRHLTLKGQFVYHTEFPSRFLRPKRTIMVYLPPSYGKDPARRYPVLYMHDGNNLFDPSTGFMGREWSLDEPLETMFQQQLVPEMIVVGVYNTEARMEEYTWYPSDFMGEFQGGWGPLYARFMVHELKPFIDHHYRTLPHWEYTGIMGSSLGGIISFYVAREYPQVFSRVGMMSPTVYWAEHRILQDVQTFPLHFKLWVDIGTEEGTDPLTEETVESTQRLVQALVEQGYTLNHNLAFYIDFLAGHDEMAWGKRVHRPLQYLFGD